MAGAILGAFVVVEEITAKLKSDLWEHIGLLGKVDDDLDGIKNTLVTVQAVLRDAEKRSVKDEEVRIWLRRLKAAAYDIDDLLSDFEDKIPLKKPGLWEELKQNVWQFFSPSNRVLRKYTLAQEIKQLRERLDNIAAERTKFHLREEACSMNEEDIRKRETFCMVDENHENTIVGRKEEKEKIISLLLQTNATDEVVIIPIVGFGGLGKTTLAQLVFNDDKLKVFDLRIWVYVSMNFDLRRIAEAIISQIEKRKIEFFDLQSVGEQLRKALHGKQYLIVLDDLWNEDANELDQLKQLLKCGKNSSKIIVTTRSQKVAELMCTVQSHHLKLLSHDDCWVLFKRRAFKSRRRQDNSSLLKIGREIAKRCQGVPLTANVLGSMMRFKNGVDAWSAMKNSSVLEIEQHDGSENKVLSSLRLSYDNMPSHLKLCFTYCSIFPKGHLINKHSLIQQWAALGFIQSTNGHLPLEKHGEEYINDLVWMSLLQGSGKHDKSAAALSMHDLVHDLAASVVYDELLVLDAEKSTNASPTHSDFRYASLINYKDLSVIHTPLLNKLRALHIKNCNAMDLGEILKKTRYLRVLDLGGCCIEQLPTSMSQLKQLRFLDASNTPIETIPEISSLCNLQALDLSYCLLASLPEHVFGLPQLRYLNLHGCFRIKSIPDSIEQLEDLLYLDLSECYGLQSLPDSIGKLHKLSFLNISHSTLHILPESTGNLSNLESLDLSYSCLEELPESFGCLHKLQMLNMSYCSRLQGLPVSFVNLINLNELNLSYCNLKELPEAFGNLGMLQSLNLSSCKKLDMLPESFGTLMNLEELYLSDCFRLKELHESLGDLQNLQILILNDCKSLRELPRSIANIIGLRYLSVEGSAVTLPVGIERLVHLQALPRFVVRTEAKYGVKSGSSLAELQDLNMIRGKLKIECLENVKNLEDAERAGLHRKRELRSLTLQWDDRRLEDSAKDQLVMQKLLPHENLEHFKLNGYPGSKFPIWMMSIACFLPNLVRITLCNLAKCEYMPPLGQLQNLEKLRIYSVPNLRKVNRNFFTGGQVLKKLRYLYLSDMSNLEEWLTALSDNDDDFLFPNLHSVQISNCPKLRFLPYLPKSIEWIIEDSDQVLSSGGSLGPPCCSSACSLKVKKCNPTSDGWEVLLHLSTLETLVVDSCKELSTLPDSIRALTSLKTLEIRHCNSMMELPKWLGDLTSLVALRIASCSRLVAVPDSLGDLKSLQRLYIRECCSLKSLPDTLEHLTSLERLDIIDCNRTLEQQCKGEFMKKIAHVPYVFIPEDED